MSTAFELIVNNDKYILDFPADIKNPLFINNYEPKIFEFLVNMINGNIDYDDDKFLKLFYGEDLFNKLKLFYNYTKLFTLFEDNNSGINIFVKKILILNNINLSNKMLISHNKVNCSAESRGIQEYIMWVDYNFENSDIEFEINQVNFFEVKSSAMNLQECHNFFKYLEILTNTVLKKNNCAPCQLNFNTVKMYENGHFNFEFCINVNNQKKNINLDIDVNFNDNENLIINFDTNDILIEVFREIFV